MPNPSHSRRRVPLGFGDLTARVGDHIVHLYNDKDEMLQVLGSFVTAGISRGDRCLVLTPRVTSRLRQWLASNRVDVRTAERSGQLVLNVGKTTGTNGNDLRKFESDTVNAGYPAAAGR